MRQPVIVEIEGREPMHGDAYIVWPGETLGEWSVQIKGNEDLYRAREVIQVTLAQPWNGATAIGRALPIELTQVISTGECTRTLQGEGPLERQQ